MLNNTYWGLKGLISYQTNRSPRSSKFVPHSLPTECLVTGMPHGAWNGNCLMAAATKAIASHIPTPHSLWLAIKRNATTACHYGFPIQVSDALGLSCFAPSLPSIIIYRMSRGGYEWIALCLFLPLMDSYRLQTDYEGETHSYDGEPYAGLLLC